MMKDLLNTKLVERDLSNFFAHLEVNRISFHVPQTNLMSQCSGVTDFTKSVYFVGNGEYSS